MIFLIKKKKTEDPKWFGADYIANASEAHNVKRESTFSLVAAWMSAPIAPFRKENLVT